MPCKNVWGAFFNASVLETGDGGLAVRARARLVRPIRPVRIPLGPVSKKSKKLGENKLFIQTEWHSRADENYPHQLFIE